MYPIGGVYTPWVRKVKMRMLFNITKKEVVLLPVLKTENAQSELLKCTDNCR